MLKLRLERARRGLTQAQLAALSGVTAQDISAIECGWRRPFPTWKERLGRALGVRDVDSLFEEVNENETTAD
ncbi:MAG: helix-turn-helix domain-containing protein [Firmicutes bacterium]|nr:helix-turn-helix domain-containing protein [Bacillota bacterium]MBU4553736.1 helix-turn-helix domain-containing protein [Bacillota bacterium]MBV1728469.1 helix-turn-helix domain-containing protein [Desulforudis sp.]MBV1735758.1 helix-turn-helix domain-containing protein [Desulforudis sp.]MBV1770104.1 helix-turn-helix domain-containing protein [Desulforudis sp.]